MLGVDDRRLRRNKDDGFGRLIRLVTTNLNYCESSIHRTEQAAELRSKRTTLASHLFAKLGDWFVAVRALAGSRGK